MGMVKNSFLKLSAGALFLLVLFGTAPIVVSAITAGGELFSDTPSAEEVCAHTEGELGLTLKVPCEEWVEAREVFVGSLYPEFKTCMVAAQTEEAWMRCGDMEHLKSFRE